jgi:hypothetical protein
MPTENGFGIAILQKVHERHLRVHPGLSLASVKWKFEKFWRMPSRVILTVRDSTTLKPIHEALAKCAALNAERLSDEEGHIVVHNTPPGEYLIDISAEDYTPIRNYKMKVSRYDKALDITIDMVRSSE